MFKPDKDFQPFFEIDHVSVDNINFVTMLRKDNNSASNTKTPRPSVIEKIIESKNSNKNILEGNKNDSFSIKETSCINQLCTERNMTFRHEFQDRIDMQANLIEATETLSILEEHLSISQQRYDEIVAIQNKNQLKMNIFISKSSELKQIQQDLRDSALGISREIRKAQNILESLSQQNIIAKNNKKKPKTDLIFKNHESIAKDENLMKHDGIYAMNEVGIYAWTCCNSTNKNQIGCTDDLSIGVKSSLPIVKNYYNNQITINHPLQHGSSLFLENNIKMKLKLNKYDKKLNNVNQNKDQYLANNSILTNSIIMNKDELLHSGITEHSSIDYFSMYKPPATANKCKTKNYIQMGQKQRPNTAIIGQSVSQRTLVKPSQRNSMQYFSHLDPRVCKYQTEQKLYNEHINEVTKPYINLTNLNNIFTQAYVHPNTSSLILNKSSLRPSSANYSQSMNNSTTNKYKQATDSNDCSIESNDFISKLANKLDYNIMDHAIQNNNQHQDQSNLNNSLSNNFKLNNNLSGNSNLQIKSIANKSMVGKIRAIHNDNVKSNKNRPLSAPNGFLYGH